MDMMTKGIADRFWRGWWRGRRGRKGSNEDEDEDGDGELAS